MAMVSFIYLRILYKFVKRPFATYRQPPKDAEEDVKYLPRITFSDDASTSNITSDNKPFKRPGHELFPWRVRNLVGWPER